MCVRRELTRDDGELPTEHRQETTRFRKPVAGLAGGVGAGKSTVAEILEQLGAGVIKSDALSHQEINAPEVRDTLVSWWGGDVVRPDGLVDRSKVASLVFSDAAQRHRLEALLHPRIAIRRADMMVEYERQPRIKMILLDSPLLYETDLDLMCDVVIFVDASLGTRVERTEKKRHWPAGELARREKSHQPLDMKRARADYICDNNSTLANLRENIERIFSQIVLGDSAV